MRKVPRDFVPPNSVLVAPKRRKAVPGPAIVPPDQKNVPVITSTKAPAVIDKVPPEISRFARLAMSSTEGPLATVKVPATSRSEPPVLTTT